MCHTGGRRRSVTRKETFGLKSLNDLDGARLAYLERKVVVSLGILVDVLEAMVGADDSWLTKLWVVGFSNEIEIGTIEDLVPVSRAH